MLPRQEIGRRGWMRGKAEGLGSGRLLTPRSALALGAILLVGAALRLALDARAPAFLVLGDSVDYFRPAHDLVRDGDFTLAAKRPVGYPLFLAGVIIVAGPSLEAAARAQHLLGLGTVVLVYLIGALAFGRAAGLLGALLVAIDGSLLLMERTVASEALYAPLLSGGILLCLLALRAERPVLFLVAGLALGLGAATRQVAQILLPLAIGVLALPPRPWKARLLAIGLLSLGFLAVAGPVAVRTYLTRGEVGTAGGLGEALFDRVRFHDGSFDFQDRGEPPADPRQARIRRRTFELAQTYERAFPIGDLLRNEFRLNRVQSDAALREAAIQVIRQEPLRYAIGTLAMFGELLLGPGRGRSLEEVWALRFDRDELAGFPRAVRTTGASELPTSDADRVFTATLLGLERDHRFGWLLGLLALLGAVRCLLADRRRGLALLPLAGGVQLLLYAALDGPLYRYRAPLEPLIALLAAGGFALLASRARLLLRRLRQGWARGRRDHGLAISRTGPPPL